MLHWHGGYNRRKRASWSSFLKSVASIIGTNGERRSQQKSLLLIVRHAVRRSKPASHQLTPKLLQDSQSLLATASEH
jgi:hypothetical protein